MAEPYFANPYQGIGQGINTAASAIADAITEARKAHEQAAGFQILADQALASGVITHDQYATALRGSDSQKNAMIGTIIRAQAFQNARSEQLDRDRRIRLEYQKYAHGLAQEQFTPPSVVAPVTSPTGEPLAYPLQTSPGQFTYKAPDRASPMMGQIYYHPDTGKAIGVYDENGRVQFYPQPNPMETMIASMYGINTPGGAPAVDLRPTPSPAGVTGQPAPSGQPQPSPAQGQGQPGTIPTTGQPQGRPIPPDVRDNALAAIKQGADPNAVRARLQQAGYDASQL
jgi:hypothetical protein